MAKKDTNIHTSGKRKSAIARATLRKGKGEIKINNKSIDLVQPKIYQMRIREPLILAGKVAEEVSISVDVQGGGNAGQADATRLAIAKALAEHDNTLKKVFLDYDRQLLVADVRQKETRKPNTQGKARSKRQKSYR